MVVSEVPAAGGGVLSRAVDPGVPLGPGLLGTCVVFSHARTAIARMIATAITAKVRKLMEPPDLDSACDLQVTVPLRAHRSRDRHDPDCHHAIVYQFWLVRGGGNGGWGRAKPIVPGGASKLALRVSTLFDVVRNAAITAIITAVAKIANTVRWVIVPSCAS